MSDSKTNQYTTKTKDIVDSWPDWKKGYKLTKYSSSDDSHEEESTSKSSQSNKPTNLMYC